MTSSNSDNPMFAEILPSDFLSATERLYSYIQNKRHHVVDNPLDISGNIGDIVRIVNSRIVNDYGINIFEDLSLDSITKYESILKSIVNDYSYSNITSRDLRSEIDLIKNSVMVSPTKISYKNLYLSKVFQDTWQRYPLSKNKLINLVKKPKYVTALRGDSHNDRENYLVTNIKTINSKESLILANIVDESGKKRDLSITTLLILTHNSYFKFVDNPTRLFLLCLDKYGIDIEINNKVKRLFNNEIIHTSMPVFNPNDLLNVIKFASPPGDEMSFTSFIFLPNRYTVHLEFVYGINKSQYFSDYISNLA